MIAGLETVTSGSIKIGDREISQLPAAKRGIGVGFESYALYPPMSVRENLLYGLKARKVKGAEQMVAVDQRRGWRWTICSTCGPPACPAVRSSASRWRGRWCATRRCCCSTSR